VRLVRGCFVTGTDTGAGKSVVAAAIVAALTEQGLRVRPVKPVLTGLDDPPDRDWPPDDELLARAAGIASDGVALRRYGPPVSPHLAAELSGRGVAPERLADDVRALAGAADALVVEGVGGLLVPLGEGWDVRRLAAALGLPVVDAARPGLGTISHTLLTLEAARAGGLDVAGVVLTPWPPEPDLIERSNRDTIAALGAVEVATLPPVSGGADPRALAAAGRQLPLDAWLSRPAPTAAAALTSAAP
jgi:dethiobiotin synthetase